MKTSLDIILYRLTDNDTNTNHRQYWKAMSDGKNYEKGKGGVCILMNK